MADDVVAVCVFPETLAEKVTLRVSQGTWRNQSICLQCDEELAALSNNT